MTKKKTVTKKVLPKAAKVSKPKVVAKKKQNDIEVAKPTPSKGILRKHTEKLSDKKNKEVKVADAGTAVFDASTRTFTPPKKGDYKITGAKLIDEKEGIYEIICDSPSKTSVEKRLDIQKKPDLADFIKDDPINETSSFDDKGYDKAIKSYDESHQFNEKPRMAESGRKSSTVRANVDHLVSKDMAIDPEGYHFHKPSAREEVSASPSVNEQIKKGEELFGKKGKELFSDPNFQLLARGTDKNSAKHICKDSDVFGVGYKGDSNKKETHHAVHKKTEPKTLWQKIKSLFN